MPRLEEEESLNYNSKSTVAIFADIPFYWPAAQELELLIFGAEGPPYPADCAFGRDTVREVGYLCCVLLYLRLCAGLEEQTQSALGGQC